MTERILIGTNLYTYRTDINHRKIDSNRHKSNSPNDRTSAKKTKQEVQKVLSLKKDLLV